MAKAFFDAKNRQAVVDLYEFATEEEKRKFKKFQQNVSVTLRVMSSTELIDVEALEKHNIKTNQMSIGLFPWKEPYDL